MPALDERPNDLLHEERVSFRFAQDAAEQLRRQFAVPDESLDHLCALLLCQRLEVDLQVAMMKNALALLLHLPCRGIPVGTRSA